MLKLKKQLLNLVREMYIGKGILKTNQFLI